MPHGDAPFSSPVTTAQAIGSARRPSFVNALLATADGTRVIAGCPGLGVYDLTAVTLLRELERDWCSPMVIANDDDLITAEYDGTVRFRRLRAPGTGEDARIDLPSSEDRATSLVVVDSGRGLLVGTERGVILNLRLR